MRIVAWIDFWLWSCAFAGAARFEADGSLVVRSDDLTRWERCLAYAGMATSWLLAKAWGKPGIAHALMRHIVLPPERAS